jgi:hypothetical protein
MPAQIVTDDNEKVHAHSVAFRTRNSMGNRLAPAVVAPSHAVTMPFAHSNAQFRHGWHGEVMLTALTFRGGIATIVFP